MSQHLTSWRFPYLPISLHLRQTRIGEIIADMEALLDTGFDGDVIVPLDFDMYGQDPTVYRLGL